MRLIKALLVFGAFTCVLHAQQPQREDPVARYVKVPRASRIVLEHVRVIDGTGEAPKDDQSVTLIDGKIASISQTRSEDFQPNDAVILDLKGDTVFPGLVGMHDHMYYLTRPDLD